MPYLFIQYIEGGQVIEFIGKPLDTNSMVRNNWVRMTRKLALTKLGKAQRNIGLLCFVLKVMS